MLYVFSWEWSQILCVFPVLGDFKVYRQLEPKQERIKMYVEKDTKVAFSLVK